jgi:hypothetical protein
LALATVLALPSRTHAAEPLVSAECPILTYHEVASRATFARQIRGYLERGYQPIGLGQLRRLLAGEDVGLWGKPFVITFDDGLASARDNALPFLLEWRLLAVFAVMPDWRGDRVHRYITNDDLRALVNDCGYEVISPTLHHANLVRERTRNFGSWQAQIVQSRARLEEIVGNGYQCERFCFPFGAYDGPDPQPRRGALHGRPLDAPGQHPAQRRAPVVAPHLDQLSSTNPDRSPVRNGAGERPAGRRGA